MTMDSDRKYTPHEKGRFAIMNYVNKEADYEQKQKRI